MRGVKKTPFNPIHPRGYTKNPQLRNFLFAGTFLMQMFRKYFINILKYILTPPRKITIHFKNEDIFNQKKSRQIIITQQIFKILLFISLRSPLTPSEVLISLKLLLVLKGLSPGLRMLWKIV